MTDLFYRNPRLLVLTIGLITVAGLSALQALPRQEDPTLSRRFATITTFYPGASAERVESLVTERIETRVRELHEVKQVESLSRTGVSLMQVELDDQYTEATVDEVWSKLRDKLADVRAELPVGALAPDFEDRTSTAITLLAGLAWDQPGPAQMALLSRMAEELANRLRNVAGTREAQLFGEAEEEIRVTIDPLELAAVGRTAADVSAAIARADSKGAAGQLRHRMNDLVLEVQGEVTTVERVREIPLRQERDRMLRVGDIARVEKTVREPPATVAILGGRPGVAVAATMESHRRVDHWAAEARAVVRAFEDEVPQGVRLELLFDQSQYTEERLGTLVGNLVMGAVLVVLVLFVLMGARSALVVSAALPLTLALVLAEMNLFGLPLHQTSITGLIIALGLLIDNAIVVVDELDVRMRTGAGRAAAVAATVRHLRVPLAASTFTTALAFLPIALMPGGAGEFVGPISLGVVLAVTSSFFLAMTLIPALAALAERFESRTSQPAERPHRLWRDGFYHEGLRDAFRSSVVICARRPWVGIGASLVLPIAGFVAGSTLSEQFFPANDRNQFQVQLVLASQASIEETERAARRARALIHRRPEVVESHWFLGESAPRVFYNMFGNEDGISSFAGAFVTTASPAATQALLPGLQEELLAAFPDARVLALPFEQGPPFEAPIEVRIVGPGLETLRALGERTREVLARTEAVTYTAAKLAAGRPKLLVAADEDQARLAGLQLGDIADQLASQLEGVVGGSLVEATEEIPVRVRVGEGERAELARIAAGRVLAPGRGAGGDDDAVPGAPLSVLADVRLVPELAGIARRNGERINTVQAFLAPYALIADSLADFRDRFEAAGIEMPAGYRIELGGEDEQRSDALAKLAAYALPLFVLMVGSIILSFDSFRMAGIIFVVAGLAVGLAQLGVWLFGHPMGFVAIVGTMGLVGLAINDSIVVLAALRADEDARAGDLEATTDVVLGATRHVVATTVTTIGGFTPLILFGGRFWPPMACAIAGGVIGCSILALYLVPALFRLSVRRDLRLPTRARSSSPARDPLPVATAGLVSE